MLRVGLGGDVYEFVGSSVCILPARGSCVNGKECVWSCKESVQRVGSIVETTMLFACSSTRSDEQIVQINHRTNKHDLTASQESEDGARSVHLAQPMPWR